jgi:hypothetical protein
MKSHHLQPQDLTVQILERVFSQFINILTSNTSIQPINLKIIIHNKII